MSISPMGVCSTLAIIASTCGGWAQVAQESPPFRPGALGMTPEVLVSTAALENHVGKLVAVRGVVSKSKQPTILGVDVAAAETLGGREAYAIGILAKWIVTNADLRQVAKKRVVASRGPGTFYTLYFDLSGKLAEARPWPTESRLESD
jgi:hypothetical protein